jgi:hypothetical protein
MLEAEGGRGGSERGDQVRVSARACVLGQSHGGEQKAAALRWRQPNCPRELSHPAAKPRSTGRFLPAVSMSLPLRHPTSWWRDGWIDHFANWPGAKQRSVAGGVPRPPVLQRPCLAVVCLTRDLGSKGGLGRPPVETAWGKTLPFFLFFSLFPRCI